MLLVIVFVTGTPFFIKMFILVFIQIICILFAILVRSNKSIRYNIWEIFSEIVYVILMASLIHLTNDNKWTNKHENMFICLMLSNALFLTLASAVTMVTTLVQKCWKCWRRDKSERLNSSLNSTKLPNLSHNTSTTSNNITTPSSNQNITPSTYSSHRGFQINFPAKINPRLRKYGPNEQNSNCIQFMA